MTAYYLRIPGRPPAKSNSYKTGWNRKTGAPTFYTDETVTSYETGIMRTCESLRGQLGGVQPFPKGTWVQLMICWHRDANDSGRKDLDNILKSIKDGITLGKLWNDDSQVKRLVLEEVADADGKEREWVDIILQPIARRRALRLPTELHDPLGPGDSPQAGVMTPTPSTASSKPSAVKRTTAHQAVLGALSLAVPALSTSDPATSETKSGTTSKPGNKSAPPAPIRSGRPRSPNS